MNNGVISPSVDKEKEKDALNTTLNCRSVSNFTKIQDTTVPIKAR
jgi:hypothetical protein